MNTVNKLADELEDATTRNPKSTMADLEYMTRLYTLAAAGAWMLRHLAEENERINKVLMQPPRILDLGDQVLRGQVAP